MKPLKALLTFAILAWAATIDQAQAQSWTLQEGQHPQTVVADDGTTTHLLLFLPQDFRSRKWPLIVFLHGGGQRGNDLKLVARSGLPKLVETQPQFKFVVASPQIAAGELWSGAKVANVIDALLKQLPVDPDRIYLTGLSIGGSGTWDVAAEHFQRFAAIAPISSKGHSGDTCLLKGVPVWAFHNERDKLFTLNGVQEAISRLRACGGIAELTIYPRDGHDAWTETYANAALYEWFLRHSRSVTAISKQ